MRRHDGRHRHVDVPRGEGAYSCEEPPHRFVDLILGRGVNNSPGDVAARSVELIEAMYRSADADGAVVTVYRGEGVRGSGRAKGGGRSRP